MGIYAYGFKSIYQFAVASAIYAGYYRLNGWGPFYKRLPTNYIWGVLHIRIIAW